MLNYARMNISSQCARALSYQRSNRCEYACVFITYLTQMANVDENYDSSSSEDEEILLYFLLLRQRRRRLRAANRKTSVKPCVSRRQAQGAC